MPGKYEVRVTAEGKTETAAFEVKLDPRVEVSRAELQEQFDLLLQIRDQLSRVYDAVNQIQDVRSQVDGMQKRLPENNSTKPVLEAATKLDGHLLEVRDELIQINNTSNEASLAYPQRVDDKLAGLAMAVGEGTDSAPTAAEYRVFEQLKKQSEDGIARWAELQRTDLAALQKMTAEQNIQAIVVPAGENQGSPVSGRK